MRILTNIRFYYVAGIAQHLYSFIDYLEKNTKKVEVVGVDIIGEKEKQDSKNFAINHLCFQAILKTVKYVPVDKAVKRAKNLKELEEIYAPVIDAYVLAIEKEKPDVVLINGTYFLPWCLFLAARRCKIPAVLHYHGLLTKETEHWDDHSRKIFLAMEKSFDVPGLFYVFPSALAKETVEKEVFAKKIPRKSYVILPNPIPPHFFAVKTRKNTPRRVGVVSRWTKIKNVKFVENLAFLNKRKASPYSVWAITDLKRGAVQRKLLPVIVFKKPALNSKMPEKYRQLGLVISPSVFETYGNVSQEALASGVPALVSPRMGIAEMYRRHGLEDWIIDFSSPAAVHKKILSVMGQSVPETLRQQLKKELNPQVIYQQLLNVIIKVSEKAV